MTVNANNDGLATTVETVNTAPSTSVAFHSAEEDSDTLRSVNRFLLSQPAIARTFVIGAFEGSNTTSERFWSPLKELITNPIADKSTKATSSFTGLALNETRILYTVLALPSFAFQGDA